MRRGLLLLLAVVAAKAEQATPPVTTTVPSPAATQMATPSGAAVSSAPDLMQVPFPTRNSSALELPPVAPEACAPTEVEDATCVRMMRLCSYETLRLQVLRNITALFFWSLCRANTLDELSAELLSAQNGSAAAVATEEMMHQLEGLECDLEKQTVLLPYTALNHILVQLIHTEQALCHCLGGELLSHPSEGVVRCTVPITCYLQPGGCFDVLQNSTADGDCAGAYHCGKLVSQARGLLTESALQLGHDTAALPGGDVDCTTMWEECIYGEVACTRALCPFQEGPCHFREYCRYAAKTAGSAASPCSLLLALLAAVALLL